MSYHMIQAMEKSLTWKKPFFSDTYSIYLGNQVIGTIQEKSFSQTAIGKLYGKDFTFNTIGIFKQSTEIIDNNNSRVVGIISYNNWMTKATISAFDKRIYWKYDNFWNTKWRIYNDAGIEIKYSGSSTKGIIESNVEDALPILCGLIVINYYWQISVAVLAAIFIPIFLSINGS